MRIAATALALAASLTFTGCVHTQADYCRANPGICALLGGAVVGGVILVARNQQPAVSDSRLKHDVEPYRTLPNGIQLYTYSYLGSDDVFVGVMAQDLLADERFADAVSVGEHGFYVVDYGKLGLGLQNAEAMHEAGAAAIEFAGS